MCFDVFIYMFLSDVCPIYVVYIYIVHTYEIYVRRTCAFCRRVTL